MVCPAAGRTGFSPRPTAAVGSIGPAQGEQQQSLVFLFLVFCPWRVDSVRQYRCPATSGRPTHHPPASRGSSGLERWSPRYVDLYYFVWLPFAKDVSILLDSHAGSLRPGRRPDGHVVPVVDRPRNSEADGRVASVLSGRLLQRAHCRAAATRSGSRWRPRRPLRHGRYGGSGGGQRSHPLPVPLRPGLRRGQRRQCSRLQPTRRFRRRHPDDAAVVASVQSSGSDPQQQPFRLGRFGPSSASPRPSAKPAAAAAPSDSSKCDGFGIAKSRADGPFLAARRGEPLDGAVVAGLCPFTGWPSSWTAGYTWFGFVHRHAGFIVVVCCFQLVGLYRPYRQEQLQLCQVSRCFIRRLFCFYFDVVFELKSVLIAFPRYNQTDPLSPLLAPCTNPTISIGPGGRAKRAPTVQPT